MASMLSPLFIMLKTVWSLFKSRRQLILENLALCQQVAMLKLSVKRPRVSLVDRLFWVLLSKYVDDWRAMLHALHPDTVVRWRREGFRRYWNWKSRRRRAGRPSSDTEIRKLIRQMQSANVGWGAPRIHGELLKLGIEIGSVRRGCLDHVIVFNERHLRRILRKYFDYYHSCRTHLSLNKDPTETRFVESPELGNIVAFPCVGGLHHRYGRIAARWRWQRMTNR